MALDSRARLPINAAVVVPPSWFWLEAKWEFGEPVGDAEAAPATVNG